MVNSVVNFSTSTFTLPSKHRKRHNIFQTTLSNNIQIPENLLTNSQVPKEIITTSSIPRFLTSTLNQTGPHLLNLESARAKGKQSGGVGGGVTSVAVMKRAKSPPVHNPNWASLQQNLKSNRQLSKHQLSSSSDPGSKTLEESKVLGKRKERPQESSASSSILLPTSDDFSLTEALAMDCEMVGVSSQGNKSALGRVTLVNEWGNIVYDEYVRPLERVVDYRTNISGIHPWNMKKAKDFMTVQKKVADLLKGRILVGHALHNDLKVLFLSHPKKDTRDTAAYQALLREGRGRALKVLAAQILGVRIQQKQHCPVQDARAAMLIYKKYQKKWEKKIKKLGKLKKKPKNMHKNNLVEKVEADVQARPAVAS